MPIEYAKYVPFDKQIDWASVSTDVSKKALEIGEDRKNRKAALDKMKSDYELKLAEQKAFKTEDVAAKWGETTNQGREVIYNAYKDLKSRKITESDYKNIVNNLTTYTDKLADHATALDADIQAYIARQQVDEKTGEAQGGAFELEKLNRLGKIADLKNKKFNVLPDGRISIDQMGEDGKVLESSFDLMSFNKKENQFAPRIYVDKLTSNIVKDWAKWSEFKDLGTGAWRNIEDIRRNPATRDALYMAVKSVNSTPKNTLSVLIDNGAIQQPLYAYSVSEIDKVKAQAEQDLINMRTSQGISTEITAADKAEIDKRIIRVDPTSGEPILTDEQKKLADETVEKSIQMKMGHEETGKSKEDWWHAKTDGGADGSGYKQKDIDEATEVYKLSKNAMMESKPGDNSNTNEYLAAIGQKMNKYVVKTRFASDGTYGLIVYDYVKSTDQYGNPVYTKAIDMKSGKPIRQAKSLAEYITGKPAGEANTIWELGKDNSIETTPVGKEERKPYDPKNKKAKAPKKGDVDSGYKFMGGDASNPKNWKKI